MADELISIEPATGKMVWSGPPGDVDAEVAAVRAGWPKWAAQPQTTRMEALRRFGNSVRQRGEAFADLIARETGKPLWEARTEIETVIANIEGSISAYSERTAQRRLDGAMGARNALRHKPHGTIAVISPFSFPAQIPAGQIIPALIAGNGVVFKPSEKAPATGSMLVECFHEAGVPQDVLRVVVGGPEHGRRLAAHPDVGGVLFAGSSAVGFGLHRQYAETPQRILALEMGGNNPIVVWDTTDVYASAILAIQSAFLSAGQRCTAARRLIVKDGAHDGLINEIAKLTGRLIVGEPHQQPAPYLGPVIDNDAADRIQEAFLDLIIKGGRAISHPDRPDAERPYLSPALIDVTGIAERPDQEIFGPVLQIVRVTDFEAAIVEANATRYGLSASLIGGSPELYNRFWANVRAGAVHWNRPTNAAIANAPLGGIGISGNFRPGGYYSADACAYPVISSETEQPRASIGIGLRDFDPG